MRNALKSGLSAGAVALAAVLAGGAAFAQDTAVEVVDAVEAVEEVVGLSAGDTAWMMTATALVLMMSIPGVALFYGGMVRKMNVLSTMMQTFAVCCLVSILWMIAGYSLAFKGDGAFIGNLSAFFLSGVGVDSLEDTIPESVHIAFQLTFAIITCALIFGAVADRMKFSAVLLFTGAWMFLVYVPVAHWVWGGGFLEEDGVLDFAGGTVVHINAGVAGLVAALVLGPRRGYGKEPMPPHNLTLSLIGAAMLWVGWFGFNGGSAYASDGAAGMAILVTQIATATAAFSWMIVEWAVKGKPSVLGIVSGAVGGLVAITPAAGYVDPTGALLIGAISGVVCYVAATSVKNALKYDDSLDAFGVHGVGGFVGAVLTGVFAVEAIGGTSGLIEGNAGQVWTQFYGAAITVVYCAIVTFIILKVVGAIVGLRVDEETERDGLDLRLHGESVH